MLCFRFWVPVWLLFLFFLLVTSEVYSSLFSCCCFCLGGNKFSIKFTAKMFKPTSSSISSMVGALWTVNFLYFLCFDVKIKAKNSNNPPREKKFAHRYYHGYSLTEVRIYLSISVRFVLYPFTLSNKMSVSR